MKYLEDKVRVLLSLVWFEKKKTEKTGLCISKVLKGTMGFKSNSVCWGMLHVKVQIKEMSFSAQRKGNHVSDMRFFCKHLEKVLLTYSEELF